MFFRKVAICIGLFLLSALGAQASPVKVHKPSLVVLIVIDQFRADYLQRYQAQFLPPIGKGGRLGGFSYLMSRSAFFPQAQYESLQNITAPGHASIATGGHPYQHGIPLNDWYNPKLGRHENCVEDMDAPLVTGTGLVEDPSSGRSPRNLQGSTIGDELKNAFPESRVVSLSLKDRSAILLGGRRADMALWTKQGNWVTSQYYATKLPSWVLQLNAKFLAETKKNRTDIEEAQEISVRLEKAAEIALKNYRLGTGKHPDFLAISFSAHDAMGHAHGPYSSEVAAITLTEDRLISDLLNAVHHHVPGGLKNVVVALTADHGVVPSANWAVQHRYEAVRIDERDLKDRMNIALNEKFGKPSEGEWVPSSIALNVYLNRSAIASKGLDPAQVELEAKRFLLREPAVAFAFTRTEQGQGILPPGLVGKQATNTYNAMRSGDVMGVLKPFFQTGKKESPKDATGHQTGYSYDRTVPLILSGEAIRPGMYATRALVTDLAPTLAFILGVLPPAVSEGRVLSEIFIAER